MTTVFRRRTLLLPALFLISSLGLKGQMVLDRTVVGNGSVAGANATFHLSATLGQPIIGSIATPQQTLWQGFWFQTENSRLSTSEPVAGEKLNSPLALHCFPNPIDRSATIQVDLHESQTIRLTLNDALGREVKSLISGERQSGQIRLEIATEEIASGAYTLILSAGDHRTTLPVQIVQ